jgi:predicted acetyltransferase
VPWLARLWATAFAGSRSAADRAAELETGTGKYGGLESCWVGELEGRRVGALRSYRMEMYLWGEPVPVQGLAALATMPDARRQGIGAHLCREGMSVGREAGLELSVLYPYRADFYRRQGYTLAGELHRYVLPPAEFPRFPEGRAARVVAPARATELLPPFYEALRPRVQGLIRRGSGLWSFLDPAPVDPPLVVVVPGPSEEGIRGYLVADLEPNSVPARATLRVREALAADLSAHRALLGWISLQRDQWGRVLYDALPGEHLERLLGHPRRDRSRGARGGGLWFPSATLLRGPMLRVLNVEAILGRAGLQAGASVAVHDAALSANSGVWRGERGGRVVRQPLSSDGAAAARSPVGSPDPDSAASAALPVAVLTELFLDGALPGQTETVRARGWSPAMGIRDFRLLNTF